jgi:hypothetical protein
MRNRTSQLLKHHALPVVAFAFFAGTVVVWATDNGGGGDTPFDKYKKCIDDYSACQTSCNQRQVASKQGLENCLQNCRDKKEECVRQSGFGDEIPVGGSPPPRSGPTATLSPPRGPTAPPGLGQPVPSPTQSPKGPTPPPGIGPTATVAASPSPSASAPVLLLKKTSPTPTPKPTATPKKKSTPKPTPKPTPKSSPKPKPSASSHDQQQQHQDHHHHG